MTNAAVVLFYIPVAVLQVYVLFKCLPRAAKSRVYGSIAFVAVMLLGWTLLEICRFWFIGPFASLFLFDLYLIFAAFNALSFLLFTLHLYNMDIYLKPVFTICLAIIPAFTAALVVTNPFHGMIHRSIVVLRAQPLLLVQSVRGPWLYVHAGYCYLILLLALLVALLKYPKLPKLYRLPTRALLVGLAVSLTANMLILLRVIVFPVDVSLVCCTFTLLMLYRTAPRSEGLVALNRVKIDLFDKLDKSVWILDDASQIISRNTTARYLQYYRNIPSDETAFEAVREKLFPLPANRHAHEDAWLGEDYHMDWQGKTRIFNLHANAIPNRQGKPIGAVVSCENVTAASQAYTRLERENGIDPLTGLFNRHTMEKSRAALDHPRSMPLASLEAHLEGLDEVNRAGGRRQGDILVRTMADILTACCPPSALVGRLRGGRFLVLIPAFSFRQAEELAGVIQTQFGAIEDLHEAACLRLETHVQDSASTQRNANLSHKTAGAELGRPAKGSFL